MVIDTRQIANVRRISLHSQHISCCYHKDGAGRYVPNIFKSYRPISSTLCCSTYMKSKQHKPPKNKQKCPHRNAPLKVCLMVRAARLELARTRRLGLSQLCLPFHHARPIRGSLVDGGRKFYLDGWVEFHDRFEECSYPFIVN